MEGGLGTVTVRRWPSGPMAIQTVYNRVGRRPEMLVAVAERAIGELAAWHRRSHWRDAAGPPRRSGRVRRLRAGATPAVRTVELRHPTNPTRWRGSRSKVDQQIGGLADIIADGIADGNWNHPCRSFGRGDGLWAMMEGSSRARMAYRPQNPDDAKRR